MANRAIIGNVVLGLGVIGLGALVVAERNGATARREAEAQSLFVASATEGASSRPPDVMLRGQGVGDGAGSPALTAGTAPTTSDARVRPQAASAQATSQGTTGTSAASQSSSEPRSVQGALTLTATITPGAIASTSPSPRSSEPMAGDAEPALDRALLLPDDEPREAAPALEERGAPATAIARRAAPEPARDDELGCDAPAVVPAERAPAKPLKASLSTAGPEAKEILAAIPRAKLEQIAVKRGDTLLSLARAHKVSTGLIRRLNGVRGDAIRAGAILSIPNGPFTATADRGSFELSIELDGAIVKKYAIGVGRDGSTPAGEFEIRSRVESPDWTSPEGDYFKSGDPANPLGSRWLGFGEGGYGIHGTTDPSSIGREASRGCVRLNAGDVEEVYDFLTIGSKVTIR